MCCMLGCCVYKTRYGCDVWCMLDCWVLRHGMVGVCVVRWIVGCVRHCMVVMCVVCGLLGMYGTAR